MTPNKHTMKIYFMITTTELTFISGLWLKPAMIGPTNSDIGTCRGPGSTWSRRLCERESKGVVGEREGGADHLRGLTLLINNLQRRDLLNCLLK
jgi:hypothetical protein